MPDSDLTARIRAAITDEIFAALGLAKRGRARRMFGWLFHLPTNRFAAMFARADQAAASGGLSAACKVVVDSLGVRVNASGIENIPASGPLMLLSNHPGAYDSVAIGAQVPRTDLSILVGDIPFYHTLPNINPLFTHIPDAADTSGRMLALRQAVSHLKNAGSLLQFGAGTIEPDPAVQEGAVESLVAWSPGSEIMLRKAPETNVVLVAASGVLLPRFYRHPLVNLRQRQVDRRRVAEFMQVISQLAAPGSVRVHMRLRFAPPISAAELLRQAGGGRLLPLLIQHETILLAES